MHLLWKHPNNPHDEIVSIYSSGGTLAIGYKSSHAEFRAGGNHWHTLPLISTARGIKLSRDGRYLCIRPLAGVNHPHHLHVFETTNGGTEVAQIPLDASQFLFAPATNYVVASDASDHSLGVWSLDQGGTKLGIGMGYHHANITHLRSFPASKNHIVSGDTDSKVFDWDLQALPANVAVPVQICPTLLSLGPKDHFGHVIRVAVSRDANLVAAGFGDGHVRVWNMDDGCVTDTSYCPKHTQLVFALEFSSDGRWLASGGGDGCVYITDLDQSQPPVPYCFRDASHPYLSITCLAFSPGQSDTLAIGTSEGEVYLLDLATRQKPPVQNPLARKRVHRLLFETSEQDGVTLLVAGMSQVERWALS